MEPAASDAEALAPGEELPNSASDAPLTERSDVAGNDEIGDGVLASDRIGTDVLDSLFTQRSIDTSPDTDREQQIDVEGVIEAAIDAELESLDNGESAVRAEAEGADSESSERTDDEPSGVHSIIDQPDLAPRIDRSISPPPQEISSTPPLQHSPTRPPIPARPSRPGSFSNPSPVQQPTPLAPLQLVTFDVGGRLFKCKASLIRKFSSKRLYHVITCGCEQIDHNTFFIDRNPATFEIILDWYRTGKRLVTVPTHINEETLKDDAKYFDVYDELLPIPSLATDASAKASKTPGIPLPPQPKHHDIKDVAAVLPRLPERPSREHTTVVIRSIPSTPLVDTVPQPPLAKSRPHDQDKRRTHLPLYRFSKREVRSVGAAHDGVPVWFSVRSHEHLIVDSVRGQGRLLVRVTDMTGMKQTFVEQAVLFDSRSWFYLQDDGRAKLQHCVLPGNHIYTFWMEPYKDLSPSPPPAKLKQQQPAPKTNASAKPPTKPSTAAVIAPAKSELEVEFRLIATFTKEEEMQDEGGELASILQAKGGGWGEAAAPLEPAGSAAPECLFLPPREQQAIVPNEENHPERDAIAEQIRALAIKDKDQRSTQAVVQKPPPQEVAGLKGALKRGGAAIVQPPDARLKPQSASHGGEKVIVHHQINIASSPRAAPASKATATHPHLQPRHFQVR